MPYVEVNSDAEGGNLAGEEEEEQEEEEQPSDQDDITPRVKFAPPTKKGTNVAGPSKRPSNMEENIQQEGTSLPPPKNGKRAFSGQKKVTSEMGRNVDSPADETGPPLDESRETQTPAQNAHPKKRKAEGRPEAPAAKTLKTGPAAKSGRGTQKVPVAKPAPVSKPQHAPKQTKAGKKGKATAADPVEEPLPVSNRNQAPKK